MQITKFLINPLKSCVLSRNDKKKGVVVGSCAILVPLPSIFQNGRFDWVQKNDFLNVDRNLVMLDTVGKQISCTARKTYSSGVYGEPFFS